MAVKGNLVCLSYLVLGSVLDTAYGTGLEDALVLPLSTASIPLQLAGTPLGHAALCTAILIFLKGHEKCGWMARETVE